LSSSKERSKDRLRLLYMSRQNCDRSGGGLPILSRFREGLLPLPPKEVVLSKKEIGQRVRAIRQERGISQVELAAALGTYQTTISAIERGVRGLTVQQVVKLAAALGVSPDRILTQAKASQDPLLKDRRFLRRLQKIERLPKRDQQALLRTIDAFLTKVS